MEHGFLKLESLSTLFNDLMDGIDKNLQTKTRDRFVIIALTKLLHVNVEKWLGSVEWLCSSPLLSAGATQLRRNVGAVTRRWLVATLFDWPRNQTADHPH